MKCFANLILILSLSLLPHPFQIRSEASCEWPPRLFLDILVSASHHTSFELACGKHLQDKQRASWTLCFLLFMLTFYLPPPFTLVWLLFFFYSTVLWLEPVQRRSHCDLHILHYHTSTWVCFIDTLIPAMANLGCQLDASGRGTLNCPQWACGYVCGYFIDG